MQLISEKTKILTRKNNTQLTKILDKNKDQNKPRSIQIGSRSTQIKIKSLCTTIPRILRIPALVGAPTGYSRTKILRVHAQVHVLLSITSSLLCTSICKYLYNLDKYVYAYKHVSAYNHTRTCLVYYWLYVTGYRKVTSSTTSNTHIILSTGRYLLLLVILLI